MGKLRFKYKPKASIDWWESLSIEKKVDFKKRFEVYRHTEEPIKGRYPDMYDMRSIRISQLADKHIMRLWVFKDKI